MLERDSSQLQTRCWSVVISSELQLRRLRSVCVAGETKHAASGGPGAKTETQSSDTESPESSREVEATTVVAGRLRDGVHGPRHGRRAIFTPFQYHVNVFYTTTIIEMHTQTRSSASTIQKFHRRSSDHLEFFGLFNNKCQQ